MALPILTPDDVQKQLKKNPHPAQSGYLAMYNSWFGGIITDPSLMMIPVDDHIVHRGDGVFEAIKVINGKAYLLDAHLARLESSAQSLSLPLPMPISEIKNVILETARIANEKNAMLRLYISRGPGGFTSNPYESLGSQMYLVVTKFAPLAAEKYRLGTSVGRSEVPVKDEWMAKIKSCNYLANVMMKKESVDRKLDFTIGVDAKGFITESSTENIVLLDRNNILVRPHLRQILKGTTMMRTFELANSLVQTGMIKALEERDLTEAEIFAAKEVFIIGTTLDVLPVTSYEGKSIGAGTVGVIGGELLKLIQQDITSGPFATPIELNF